MGTPLSIKDSSVQAIASRHGQKVAQLPLSLYDLSIDPGETNNLADQHPDGVAWLKALAEPYRAELGDSLTGQVGSGVRSAGRVP